MIMDSNIVKKLIRSSQDKVVSWKETSLPLTYSAKFDGEFYTISTSANGYGAKKIELCRWDINGDSTKIKSSEDNLFCLYNIVLESDLSLQRSFDSFMNKEGIERSVSLYKVMKWLGYEVEKERPRINIKESEYFYYAKSEDDKYIQPPMKQLETAMGIVDYSDAEIILVSAPGATGKTAMSNYISAKLDIPILNLGKYEAVGVNSISGLLMKDVEQNNIFVYSEGLRNGTCSMILDGLDEAYIHITQDSFKAFVRDIAFFARKAKGIPFIILGRPAVMENASLVLEMNDVKTVLLQIEPFTVSKAKAFIDKQMPPALIGKYCTQYNNVRDYIIEEIGGFFKDESEMSNNVFERFIGYAPVLTSIKVLLSEKPNFHSLLLELKENQKQRIDLLIDVVDRILLREQAKIHEEVLPQLFEKERDDAYRKSIMEKCGTKKEQCYRILSYLICGTSIYDIFDDGRLNDKYNEKMNSWIANHPFVSTDKKWFENIVFESYVIAYLSNCLEYKETAIKGLEGVSKNNSCSYLFTDLYDTISSDNNVDYRMVPYLIASFKTLDTPKNVGTVEIVSEEDNDVSDIIECEMSLGNENSQKEYDFTFNVGHEESLPILSPISSVTIDAPIDVIIKDTKTEFIAPVFIRCRSLTLRSRDVLLSSISDGSRTFVESAKFEALCDDGSLPTITNLKKSLKPLSIVTDSSLSYPFSDYSEKRVDVAVEDKDLKEKYQKFRRMMLMFRSHSKGELARCCSKIDKRIGKSDMGRAIIAKLQDAGVMKMHDFMYFIDYNRFAEVIGAKYDDIRSGTINDNMRKFLAGISVGKK